MVPHILCSVFPVSMENWTKTTCSSHALMTDLPQHAILSIHWKSSLLKDFNTLRCVNRLPIAFRSAES